MSLIATGDDREFKQCPAGTHLAICIGLIDLGIQSGEYEGKTTERHQVMIRFETPHELAEDNQPMILGAFVTMSLGKKAKLRSWLESWRGRAFTAEELNGFNLTNIIGKPCMLSVIHNDKDRARINGIMALPKGFTDIPRQHNPTLIYDVDSNNGDVFDKLPGGIQAMINNRVIRKEPTPQYEPGSLDGIDDDLPF